MHPRYRDYVLSQLNGEANYFPAPLLDNAEQDGEGSDVEAEHARTSSSSKTCVSPDGTLFGNCKHGQSVGHSVPSNSPDKPMV